MTLRGADPDTVAAAIADRDPLSGSNGFAGQLDGTLVRDVLGREPLFVEAGSHGTYVETSPEPVVEASGHDPVVEGDGDDDANEPDPTPLRWSFDPTDLDDPESFPAGHLRDETSIEHVLTLSESTPQSDGPALDALRAAIDDALEGIDGHPPVAFSGGVDSGLVATGCDGPLYVAGFPDSHDVEAARRGAERLGRDLVVVELDHETIRTAAVEVARAIGRTNAMDVSIAIPLYLTACRAAEDGFERLAVGQGADELFGGYAKVAKAPGDPRVDAETIRSARDETVRTLPDQLERDVLAIRAAGVEPVAPLLNDRVVEAALALPETLLVDGDRRKVALRTVAADRLPAVLAERDKKALQYGSLVSRELDRLARQAGFKRRMDDHVTRYVESLLADGPAEREQ